MAIGERAINEIPNDQDKTPFRVIDGGKDSAGDPTGGLSTIEFMRKSREDKAKREEEKRNRLHKEKVDAYRAGVLERTKKFEIKQAQQKIQSLSPTGIDSATLDKAGMTQTKRPDEQTGEEDLLNGLENDLNKLDNRIFDILQNQIDQLRWPPLRKMKETKAHKILMETDGQYQGLISQRASVAEDVEKIKNVTNKTITKNVEAKLAGDDTVAQDFFNKTPNQMAETDEESRKMAA